MKNSQDPRHLRRERIMRSLFNWSFRKDEPPTHPVAVSVIAEREKIDNLISKAAPEWPIQQINRLDLAVLQLAVFELVIAPKEPPKVIIDEAVELAKTYGSERSSAFVNGVLGAIYKSEVELKKETNGNPEDRTKTES